MMTEVEPGQSGDSAPESNPVSWQTIYWTLVPLAVLTITQPSGQVLGTKIRYRAYFRSSPIICAFDTLSIILRLVWSIVSLRLPTGRAFDLLIENRFKDILEDERIVEGISGLKKAMAWRWFGFIFGCLGPFIKLMSMSGIPWTQAYGSMFLLSFLAIELLVVVEQSRVSIESRPHLWRAEENALERIDTALNTALFALAIMIHEGILCWVILELWPRPYTETMMDMLQRFGHEFLWFWFSLGLSIGWTVVVAYIPAAIISGIFIIPVFRFLMGSKVSWKGTYQEQSIVCTNMIAGLFLAGAFLYHLVGGWRHESIFDSGQWTGPKPLLMDLGVLLSIPIGSIIVYVLLMLLGLFSPLVGESLLLVERLETATEPTVDTYGCALLLFFLGNIVSFTLWYSKCYSELGTTNPSWTSIFG